MNRRLRSLHLPNIRWAGLLLGPVVAALLWVTLPASYTTASGDVVAFTDAARATTAVGAWMALWWLTEAIEVSATALLPLVLFPLLGVASIRETAAPYAHDLIFLFMGGFILSLSMQRWGLHRRIALLTLRLVGTKPRNMVGGFMLTSAVMSMWVSNTAAVVMMLPIAVSVIALVGGGEKEGKDVEMPEGVGKNFAICMMLGIAYGASIGGIGTVIGSPPNLFVVSYIADNLGQRISFARWMAIGLPLVAVFLPLTWLLLTRFLYPIRITTLPGADEMTRSELRRLGPMNTGERATFIVFSGAVVLWIVRPLLEGVVIAGATPFAGLTDTGVAMLAALALFVIPVNVKERTFAMNWRTAEALPWGVLVLFGGGLTLARAVETNGVGDFIGAQVAGLSGASPLLVVVAVVTLMVFLTELTSNTATTATLVPILAGLAPVLGLDAMMLIIPAAIAASCAFMMPVATPPNAIVFASGHVTIPQMARAGIWLNLLGIILVVALAYTVLVRMI